MGGTKTLWYARMEAVRDVEIKRSNKTLSDAKAKQAQLEASARRRK